MASAWQWQDGETAAKGETLESWSLRWYKRLPERWAEVLAEAAEARLSIRNACWSFLMEPSPLSEGPWRTSSTTSTPISSIATSTCPHAIFRRMDASSPLFPFRDATRHLVGEETYSTRSRQDQTRTPEELPANTHQHPGAALHTLPIGVQGSISVEHQQDRLDVEEANKQHSERLQHDQAAAVPYVIDLKKVFDSTETEAVLEGELTHAKRLFCKEFERYYTQYIRAIRELYIGLYEKVGMQRSKFPCLSHYFSCTTTNMTGQRKGNKQANLD
ncbi:unnamed protein product [Heligmosomoides polygyrus]|uniref:Integrase_SAM-like_N domain-containing protein n=1 Tax=Heligmosomoides polygyrus TaxID=6339 RepID=A0A3P7X9A8_HELPZ|nr:unnamed protein product [Heligmosomoides polygyrus]